jgi:hypothetical protein
LIVASGFRVAGWVIGVPSVIALLGSTAAWIDLRFNLPPVEGHYLDVEKYGLRGLLENGARTVVKIFEFFGGVALWVLTIAAAASLMMTLFAVLLYVVGRGISQHSTVARVAAILISIVLLLCSLGPMAALQGGWRALACLGPGLSFYMLWVLCFRFA